MNYWGIWAIDIANLTCVFYVYSSIILTVEGNLLCWGALGRFWPHTFNQNLTFLYHVYF